MQVISVIGRQVEYAGMYVQEPNEANHILLPEL